MENIDNYQLPEWFDFDDIDWHRYYATKNKKTIKDKNKLELFDIFRHYLTYRNKHLNENIKKEYFTKEIIDKLLQIRICDFDWVFLYGDPEFDPESNDNIIKYEIPHHRNYKCDICDTEKSSSECKCYYVDIGDNKYIYVCKDCFDEKSDMQIGKLSAKQWLSIHPDCNKKMYDECFVIGESSNLDDYVKFLYKNKMPKFICTKCKKIYNAKFGIFIVDEMNLCSKCYEQHK
jgi:hypothetical protein